MVMGERWIRRAVNCTPTNPADYLLALLAVSGASHPQSKAFEMGGDWKHQLRCSYAAGSATRASVARAQRPTGYVIT